ncbi:adenylate/guanylate cyclase domain-containing protein [Erythrobacter sp. HL-111]|uniref:adenylate/guanylate cyclase domain-containing protein n=1 Tax=Erythrobacter sp. HL-111 TaxID=1798193 RepID=UPI0006DB8CDA|nr:adenylate/guanylate cyclase domain-containing protein [Erythrobacter sp. HL-111]KPP92186.1 MAG: adenylate cyclase [Erythrobacteraceae bacterium HL-111]SDS38603.1 adenylate/guanylate cyclase [Erythrobacter sp. HL-111]
MAERSDTGDRQGGNVLARGWRSVREAGTLQLAGTLVMLLLALMIARFSWTLPFTDAATPLTNEAERALYDLRNYYAAELAEQDDRILLVVYNDQTLIKAQKRSPLDRGMLAEALRNLDALEPKAIGIDILFDQPQAEDDELIETLRAMNTPVAVGYANVATNQDDIVYEQQVFLDEFMSRLEGSKARPASIRLDNSFGATRVWPSIEPGLPPLLGRAMLHDAGVDLGPFRTYEGAIEYRRSRFEEQAGLSEAEVSEDLFESAAIDLFVDLDPTILPFLKEQYGGRYVLIGGDIVDYDRVETTFTSIDGEVPPGLAVHAEIIAQMLDGKAMALVPSWVKWAMAVLVVVLAALAALLEWPARRRAPLLALILLMLIGIPVVLEVREVDTYRLPAVGWLVGWVLAFTAVTTTARAAGAKQRRFAQGALGKYIPRDIAQAIIDRPELLSLGGEKRAIYVLFSDLEGFTKMSHAIPPEMVAKLLNRYLELLSRVVLDHGGVIDKFVGDAVVAFWGAPIARADDGERAARAGYAIWQAGEDFRREVAEMDPALPPIGKTRVGLHYGEAVIGNFGGDTRIQYTALGDSMNTAARLEAANKPLESSVMASREFAEASGLDWWRAMGRVCLRGRAKPVDLYEPAPDFPAADRAALEQASRIAPEDAGKAAALVDAVLARHPQDKALINLRERMNALDERGAYVLG